jgi:dynein heavy chain, axonemal
VVDSWIERLECVEHKPLLAALFEKYVHATLERVRRYFKVVVPLPEVNQVQTLCKLLEGCLPKARIALGFIGLGHRV